jgi:hypothetical protein
LGIKELAMKKRFLLLLTLILVVALGFGCLKQRDPQTVAEMKEKLSDKVGLMLWKVDATKEQKGKIDQLLGAMAIDLLAFQQEDKAIKRSLITALYADPVDQPTLADLHKKGLDLFDRYTTRMNEAAIAASAILTVAQRRQLLALWREWELGD